MGGLLREIQRLVTPLRGDPSFTHRRRRQAYRYFQRLNIPFLPPKSFLFGSTTELGNVDPQREQEDLVLRYGRVAGFFFFGTNPFVSLADHHLVKQVLVQHFDKFHDMPNSMFDQSRRYLFALRGAHWKRVRSVLSGTFTARKLRAVVPKLNSAVDVLLQVLAQHGAAPIDIGDTFKRFTLQVIGESVFGLHVDAQRNRDDAFYRAVATMIATRGGRRFAIAGFRYRLVSLTDFIFSIACSTRRSKDTFPIWPI